MTYILSLFFIVFNSIQKKLKFSVFIFFIFMCILAGFNYWNADRWAYESFYNTVLHEPLFNAELGFNFLNRISIMLGLSFDSFWLIYFIIGLSLIYRVIYKYTTHPGFALSLYFIFPFLMDVVQIRNFMMMAIVVSAVFLLTEKTRKNIIVYILLCLLAATIHVAALFYVLFALVPFISKEKLLKIVLVGVPIITILTASIIPIIIQVLPFVEDSLIIYTRSNISTSLAIFFIFYFLGGIMLIFSLYKRFNTTSIKYKISHDFAEVILKINILIFMAYPFILYTIDFFRLAQNISVLNYVFFTNVLFIRRNKIMSDLLVNIAAVIYFLLPTFIFYSGTNFYTVVRAVFENNSFFF